MASRSGLREANADRRRVRLRAMASLALVSALAASARSGVAADGAEFSTDCSHTYVNKAVGKEQWAITWDLVSRVSGNVFRRDGGAPSFVECFRRAVRAPGQLSFECFGASSCANPPCSQKWQSLGEVAVPEAFFYPKGVDPQDPKASCAPDLRVCPEGCPFAKIGDAIEASPPGSFIHVAEGVYKEIVKAGEKAFTLYGEPGAVLEGSPSGSQVPLASDVMVQVKCDESAGGIRRLVGLTIRGEGPRPGAWIYPYTGGIWNLGCDVSIEDSVIEDHHATSAAGGGAVNSGRMVVARTTFARNGGSSGGAIANDGILDVIDGRFIENNAPDGPDYNGGGGAIINAASADAVIVNSRFDGNKTSYGCCAGGAILNWGALDISSSVVRNSEGSAITNWGEGRLAVRSCRLEGSTAQGGIFNEGFASIEDSFLRGNFGRNVGGIENIGEVVVRDSILSGNSSGGASAAAGGFLNRAGRAELERVVFEGNSCDTYFLDESCHGALANFSGVVVGKELVFRDNVPAGCTGVDFSCE